MADFPFSSRIRSKTIFLSTKSMPFIPSSSAFPSSTSSSLSSPSPSPPKFITRTSSTMRKNTFSASPYSQPSSSVWYRSASPNRSISMNEQQTKRRSVVPDHKKRTCACSPTTHPGSFRCARHRKQGGFTNSNRTEKTSYNWSNSLNFKWSGLKNSSVRIGGVEGQLMKRAFLALIQPSAHHQRRLAVFEPRPSRLSRMSKAEHF